jgi:hypothetical protein
MVQAELTAISKPVNTCTRWGAYCKVGEKYDPQHMSSFALRASRLAWGGQRRSAIEMNAPMVFQRASI